MDPLLVLVMASSGLAVGLIVFGTWKTAEDVLDEEGVAVAMPRLSRDAQVYTRAGWAGLSAVARLLGRAAGALRSGEEVDRIAVSWMAWSDGLMERAHLGDDVGGRDLLGAMGVGILAGLLAGAAFQVVLPGLLAPACLAAFGAVLPVLYVRDLAARRRERIAAALPTALDLMTLCVEAGLDFYAAIQRIVEEMGASPLAEELRTVLREVRMGKPRTEALRDLARRVQINELTSVVAALVQAEEVGASLGPTLRVQADFIRTRRLQFAEEQAAKAPTKLMLPLVTFIFPTVFIVVLGPVILKLLLEGGFSAVLTQGGGGGLWGR